jgi:small redox-active disulfide protein 2
MKQIKIFGSGCKNCTVTADLLEKAAISLGMQSGIDFKIEKVTDLEAIMTAGVLSTPAVAINDQLVHSGSVPDAEKVRAMLK